MTEPLEISDDQPAVRTRHLDSLEREIGSRLRNSVVPFWHLVRSLEGAYPAEVLRALKSLEVEDGVRQLVLQDLGNLPSLGATLANENGADNSYPGVDSLLPEPHPLDYDWRFTKSGLSVLEAAISRLGVERLAMLGAPSLYLHLWRKGKGARLYDKNPDLIERLRTEGLRDLVCCDLFDHSTFREEFDLVVADPPWYLDYYSVFIEAARSLTTVGGFMLLSVLPKLTRPSAITDREEILKIAQAMGFDLLEQHHAVLSYSSPPFEVAALIAEGLWNGDWRLGDLFVFVKSSRLPKPLPTIKGEPNLDWAYFTIGRTSVRVKKVTGRAGPFQFAPASVTGDLRLHSVSRRSPARATIDVWNSRNLALKVSRPEYLIRVLCLNEDGIGLQDAVKRVAADNALDDASRVKLAEVVTLLSEDAGVSPNG
jgi:hypothetical protein